MQWRNTADRFGAGAQLLHWTLFLLLAWQVIGVQFIDAFPRDSVGRAFMLAAHETGGMTVLVLVAIRLAWKIANQAPLEYGPQWQQWVARLTHASLYALMVVIPVIGYVVASARGQDPMFYGVALPAAVAANRPLARSTVKVHGWLSWTMAAIVGVHAAAALWHHFVVHDATLRRMLPERFFRRPSVTTTSAAR